MIRHISIKNFAIIENVEIDFNDGLNIITGETGAGKSVVIEAVSLALGSRADTAFVRSGTDKAIIQLVATLDDADGTEDEKEYIMNYGPGKTKGQNSSKLAKMLYRLLPENMEE